MFSFFCGRNVLPFVSYLTQEHWLLHWTELMERWKLLFFYSSKFNQLKWLLPANKQRLVLWHLMACFIPLNSNYLLIYVSLFSHSVWTRSLRPVDDQCSSVPCLSLRPSFTCFHAFLVVGMSWTCFWTWKQIHLCVCQWSDQTLFINLMD